MVLSQAACLSSLAMAKGTTPLREEVFFAKNLHKDASVAP
jgi:hypothetical protein